MHPLSVSLLRTFVMCSRVIRDACSFIGAYPSPISVVGRYIPSIIGTMGMSQNEFLAALLSSLSIVSS